MVEHQIKDRGISNPKLLKVMKQVPRHEFVPHGMRASAYDDSPLPIGCRQTISQPYMVALMTDILGLKGDEKVLEIGAGSGYQAAILSKLAKKVYTIERMKELAGRTKELLRKLGYENIKVIHGDGTKGYEKQAPYDAIIITAASENVPPGLLEQLADNGRLAVPIGPRYHQELIRITKKGNKLKEEYFGGCIFVPLIGDD
ncbi:MAG: protein-L-isoaspartate(D-aspartate) O-methyltransferase [Nanoarchaeota archaeon]|nr:protein-L-isoaspartate(D-aspartate) O-methyltransferase [Nanoarchaeota archaeon]MBU1321035.1 protein-L-isoaspartate(D-aspartate) O-methyltransferase [Nanoarchaeota archaeon]MBU1598449.1 protein-L-isoaspartate(D-aspartate) O-methyltransferase [Nanoarchaeota archaeon]MBU2441375.1 protein-L-isoaspartate(D-aspartate) O-methyltransferase [Nanoarchaeota archaeon]